MHNIQTCGATRLGAMRPLSAYKHTPTFDHGVPLRLAYYHFSSPSGVHSRRTATLPYTTRQLSALLVLRYLHTLIGFHH